MAATGYTFKKAARIHITSLRLTRQRETLGNMAGCKVSVVLVAACIIILCSGTEGLCRPIRCIRGDWSAWSGCNHPCGSSGTRTRTIGIVRRPNYCDGGPCIRNDRQVQDCNRFCHNGGRPQYGRCSCSAAFRGACCQISEYCLNIICYVQSKETWKGIYRVNYFGDYMLRCTGYTGYTVEQAKFASAIISRIRELVSHS